MSKVKFEVKGGKELAAKLRALGADAKAALIEADTAGANVILDAANAVAPGPHVVFQITKKSATSVEVSIGPDKEHWYYRFFELGAGPHEIVAGLSARRQVRLAHGGRAPKQELQTVTKESNLSFQGNNGLVIIHEVSHPGMAARPFLRPAIDMNKDNAVSTVMGILNDDVIKKNVK